MKAMEVDEEMEFERGVRSRAIEAGGVRRMRGRVKRTGGRRREERKG